jgi:tRNA A-37 threonylcarbamoyl transferase component Bud32
MNTGEECEVGAGCNEFTCKCKRDLGFYPDDPPSLSCLRDVLNSTDECMSMATCDECIHINCLWCPSESLCLPSRTYSDCETACGVSPEKDPLLIEQEEEFTRKIIIVSSTVGGGLVLIIGVVIAWYVYRKRQLAKMGLTDDYELLTDDDTASNSRAQLLALLQHRAQTENNNKIDDNRIVSKYGIKRSEVHDTDLTNDWIPPADSKGVLLREMPIKISKEMLDFGKGLNQFKVGQAYEDRFTLSWPKQRGGKNEGINFQLHPPTSPKFTITFTPSQGTVKEDKLVEIRVKLVVNMTTEAEVAIGLQLPLHQVHSYMVFNVIGEMSTFIDFDEIQINRQLIIGDGAYGTVYRGKYRGQDVAIKVLKIQDMPDEMLDEFDREIDLMTKLRHKNIVQFVGASKVRGKLAIVTEFIELGNLTRLMDTCQLSYLIKLKIAVDAAKAVNFLHQNKILHRDLKPDNLLVVSLSPDPATVSVKLADFGTARAVSEKLANKYTMGIGTPMYMAPEIMAKTHYDLKADIYSFALILWALWVQKEPFTEFEHPWEIARHVLEGNRPIIPQDCPDAFRDLVTQCWATDPALRPTAEQLVTILETMFDEEIHKEVDKKRKRKEKKHGLLSASSRDNTATDLDTILLL